MTHGMVISALLYSSLEHLSSNSKNIKESLQHITEYIKNKSIDKSKANNITDLKGMGNAAWQFISALYESKQDFLVTNNNNRTFRQQVAAQFTLKLHETRVTSKSDKYTDKPASFVKHPSLIPAKMTKEVNKISKFFKKTNKQAKKRDTGRFYAQVLLPKTSEILKIEETFLKLQTNKINNIYKIINGSDKPKPKINMTTKEPSSQKCLAFILLTLTEY